MALRLSGASLTRFSADSGGPVSDVTERLSASIVAVGKFNPAIFSPSWLEKFDIISASDAASAEMGVVHPEITVFRAGGFAFDIRTDRFSCEVESEPLVRVLDATATIFGDLLPHMPIEQIGINYIEHFRLKSAGQRIALGRALAPAAIWGEWGKRLDQLPNSNPGGLIVLAMQEPYDPPGSGQRRVEVQPSAVVEPRDVGVFIAVNDHNNLVGDGTGTAAAEFLRGRFDRAVSEAREIVSSFTEVALSLDPSA